MANARCEKHSNDLITGATRNKYVARVEPFNYPNTAVICGRVGCTLPALIHLNEEEWRNYLAGERFFNPHTLAVKIKVSEKHEMLPQ